MPKEGGLVLADQLERCFGENLSAAFFSENFSGDHAPEYSVLCRDGVFSVFEAYGREGLETWCVSRDQDHSSSIVCLHGRIFSSRPWGLKSLISIKELNKK